MKKMVMVAAILLAVVMVASGPAATHAEDLSSAQIKALEGAGVPVYPDATYTTGDDEVATIMWFKSLDSPEKIMDWYEKNLSGWSVLMVNGSKIVYKGPGGIEAKDLGSKPYIFTRTKDEDPGSTDSEITVRIPK